MGLINKDKFANQYKITKEFCKICIIYKEVNYNVEANFKYYVMNAFIVKRSW